MRRRSRKVRRTSGRSVTWEPEIPFDLPTDTVHFVAHNLSNELAADLVSGVAWLNHGQMHDTKVAARVTGEGIGSREVIGLKALRDEYLSGRGFDRTKGSIDEWLVAHGLKPGKDIHYAPPEIAGAYAADDALSTLLLFDRWMPRIVRTESPDSDASVGWWWQRGYALHRSGTSCVDLYELEIAAEVNAVLCTMRGSCYDVPQAIQRTNAAEVARESLSQWITRTVGIPGFNCGSDTDVKKYLHGPSGLQIPVDPVHLTDSFKDLSRKDQERLLTHSDKSVLQPYASTNAAALDAHAKKFPQHQLLLTALAAYNKMQTVLTWASNYRDKWCMVKPDHFWLEGVALETGETFEPTCNDTFLYHSLSTVGALSGRMTSQDPNGQNAVADDKLVLQVVSCDSCGHVCSAKDLKSPACPKCNCSVRNILDRIVAEVASASDVARWNECVERDGLKIMFGIRKLFTVRKYAQGHMNHVLRPIDLSQIEVRRFAWRSGNKLLLDGYGRAPTAQQIQEELRAILDYCGKGDGALQEYLARPALDPYRHWTGRNLDTHSLMSDITTLDPMATYGLDRTDFSRVLQLIANAEDEAIAELVTLRQGDTSAAKALFKQLKQLRKDTKGVTFGVLYGMGEASLSIALNRSIPATRDFLENQYFKRLPEAKGMAKQIGSKALERFKRDGNAYVFNSYGRRFLLDVAWFCFDRCAASGKMVTKAEPCPKCRPSVQGEYVLPNRLIQGDAAGDFKIGYVRINEMLRLPALGGGTRDPITNLPVQDGFVDRPIHDENVISLPRYLDTPATDWALRSAMTLIGDKDNRNVPLATSSERCVTSWASKESVVYSRFNLGAF
jgi:hypothetical protein